MQDNGFPDEEIGNLTDAVARVHRQIQEGAAGVKLLAGAIVGGEVGVLPMPLDQARALVEAAHAEGKPVFTHPSNRRTDGIHGQRRRRAGAHDADDGSVACRFDRANFGSPHGSDPDPDTVRSGSEEIRRVGAGFEGRPGRSSAASQCLFESSGEILFRTDVGYTDAYDTTEEYRLLGRALDWRQILKTLTAAPAKRFGYAVRKGRLARGIDADLVVLDDDPSKDITAFARVHLTARGGRTIYDAKARPTN